MQEVLGKHQPACPTGADFSPNVEAVMPLLLRYCNTGEEGIRNMVAECLGTAPACLVSGSACA